MRIQPILQTSQGCDHPSAIKNKNYKVQSLLQKVNQPSFVICTWLTQTILHRINKISLVTHLPPTKLKWKLKALHR